MITLDPELLPYASPQELANLYTYMLEEAKSSKSWEEWLLAFASSHTRYGFAEHHKHFWNWVYAVEDSRPRPYIAIWPRGGAKSTSAELAVVNLGARGVRRYCLYISETQEQADDHVSTIATLLESRAIEGGYPDMANPLKGKYGNTRGWRRNRMRTASGFTVDALGLDTAARGVKLDEMRPDLMVFDDLDGELDTPATTLKKERILTHRLIPAGAENLAVIGVQNIVRLDGIFGNLASGRADYLGDRLVSGPVRAIEDFAYDEVSGQYVVSGGRPTWEGQGLQRCQEMIQDMGITAFLSECQQDAEPPEGGMFSHLTYQHVERADVPDLIKTVVWVDPAVSSTDQSDAHGIQCDGIAEDGKIYRLRSYEHKGTPLDTIKKALTWALDEGASEVGIETDMGGDTWKSVYRQAVQELGIDMASAPKYRAEKAGGTGPKVDRAGQMLADYERGDIIHVIGSHQVLERALRRFPILKPYDLVDAAFWSWRSLRPAKRKRMRTR